ncbi:MAG: thioredoxin family protein [Fimbriimonadaceae bacterium]
MKKLLPLFALMLWRIRRAQEHKQVHPVDHVLAAANKQAKAESKNVMVMIHASWCTWCHRMDDWLTKNEQGNNGRQISGYCAHHGFGRREAQSRRESRRCRAPRKTWWRKTEFPSFAILTPQGKMLANSNPNEDKPGNIGFPVEKDELPTSSRC